MAGPDDAPIFAELLGSFAARLTGRPGTAPPRSLRFPNVPAGALGPAISSDLRVRHWQELLEEIPRLPERTLLDFGCGAARTRGRIRGLGYAWKGIDVPDSQESGAREDDSDVTLYNGLRVPFPDGSFHVVLSTQVFEHVTDPHLTIAEVGRILERGGFLVGSTSHLEPFHSDSTFTYTPAVFAEMLAQNGLVPIEISAGMDGMTLMSRRLARQFGAAEEAKVLNPFFTAASPLNQMIEEAGIRQGIDPRRINALKLELVGQFHFLARKR